MSDAEEMAELLRYSSFAKVARALGVSRNAVSEWARGNDVNPHRVNQVRNLLRPPSAEPEPPAWVERVLASLMLQEDRVGATDAELARAQARAAAFLVAGPQARTRRGGGDAGGASGA